MDNTTAKKGRINFPGEQAPLIRRAWEILPADWQVYWDSQLAEWAPGAHDFEWVKTTPHATYVVSTILGWEKNGEPVVQAKIAHRTVGYDTQPLIDCDVWIDRGYGEIVSLLGDNVKIRFTREGISE